MDEDIEIINTQTRNEKIKNFFINNKNSLISILVIIILALIGYFSFEEYQSILGALFQLSLDQKFLWCQAPQQWLKRARLLWL